MNTNSVSFETMEQFALNMLRTYNWTPYREAYERCLAGKDSILRTGIVHILWYEYQRKTDTCEKDLDSFRKFMAVQESIREPRVYMHTIRSALQALSQ